MRFHENILKGEGWIAWTDNQTESFPDCGCEQGNYVLILSDNTSHYVIILSDKEKGLLSISLTKSIRETIKE